MCACDKERGNNGWKEKGGWGRAGAEENNLGLDKG